MPNNANNSPAIQYHSNLAELNTALISPTPNYLTNDPFYNRVSPGKFITFPATDTIIASPRTVSFTVNTLGTTKHTYASPLISDIQNLVAFFADWGFSYQIVEGPIYTLTVDVSWDDITLEDYTISEYSSEQWELLPIEGSKSIIYNGLLTDGSFVNPSEQGGYTVMPVLLQGAVQRANAVGGTYLNITGSLSPTDQDNYAPFIPEANQILQYLKLGIEGIPQYTQQLKRTACIDIHNTQQAFLTAADNQRFSLSEQGTVNYVLSTLDMIENYAIPEAVQNNMLPSYVKNLGIPNLDPILYSVYAGWLVTPPVMTFIGLNKIQISQTFSWNEWADGLYYIPSSPDDFPLY